MATTVELTFLIVCEFPLLQFRMFQAGFSGFRMRRICTFSIQTCMSPNIPVILKGGSGY